MDNMTEIEERVDELYSRIEDIHAELYSLGGIEERIEIFAKLRELILEKDQEGDDVAVAVLGWAYEQLGNI